MHHQYAFLHKRVRRRSILFLTSLILTRLAIAKPEQAIAQAPSAAAPVQTQRRTLRNVILHPAGRNLTSVIAVYDTQNPAPQPLQASWTQFQQGTLHPELPPVLRSATAIASCRIISGAAQSAGLAASCLEDG